MWASSWMATDAGPRGADCPRALGHKEGVEAIRRVVEAAPKQAIGTLTLYAFSCDNWRRPEAEVSALMGLLRLYLRNEIAPFGESGVRLSVIGRATACPRDSPPPSAEPRP